MPIKNKLKYAIEFILDILFPKFCLNCKREGEFICQDCLSLVEILNRRYCPFCAKPKIVLDGKTCDACKNRRKLTGLYCASSYDNFIVRKIISRFKYKPYLKELSKPLSYLIIAHLGTFGSLEKFKDFIIIPVPLHTKKMKMRGFNPAEEIGKETGKTLGIPVFNNVLIKTKSTPAQVELKKEKREENVKDVFACQSRELIENRKILLIDDVFTTGSTMEECAMVLKESGAREVWGIVAARG
jgi:ComF family protein